MNMVTPSLTGKEIVDEYFVENRTRVLEIAAFLDRLDRVDNSYPGHDFRMKAFSETLAILAGASGDRVTQIQMLLSDPTAEPLPSLDRKSALGAFDRWGKEVRS